jgi:hypothetical protein
MEETIEAENPQRGRGEALAKAIVKKANGKTNQEQQDFYLGLLMELELHATAVVEAGLGTAEGVSPE